jgi:uncharacterized membrane protein YeaQ/YmgE (transglycosylase-associated protein family)
MRFPERSSGPTPSRFSCHRASQPLRTGFHYKLNSEKALVRLERTMSGQSLLVILLVGLIAGWLAGKIVRGTGFGFVADLCIGIIGAFIGDWLLPRLGIHLGSGIVAAIIAATVGAILLLIVLGLINRRAAGKATSLAFVQRAQAPWQWPSPPSNAWNRMKASRSRLLTTSASPSHRRALDEARRAGRGHGDGRGAWWGGDRYYGRRRRRHYGFTPVRPPPDIAGGATQMRRDFSHWSGGSNFTRPVRRQCWGGGTMAAADKGRRARARSWRSCVRRAAPPGARFAPA